MSDKSVSSYLTGRRRYRREDLAEAGPLMEVLVLQVEKSIWRGHKWVCEWSDATLNDVNPSEIV